MKNRYKTLIFDLDGTAIPNKLEGMPSKNLITVVRKLQKDMNVCAATGRPFFNSKPIIDALELRDLCIISGGTQIVDPASEKIIWEKNLLKEQVDVIIALSKLYPYRLYWSDDKELSLPDSKVNDRVERIVYIMKVSKEDAEELLQKLNEIPDLIAHKVMSWTPDHFDIHITHASATKENAVQILLKLLDVEREYVIAAGDSDNDLPLFEAAGYKITMENGSEEMKKKADFIAGKADEDGLAQALEELLL